MKTLNKDLAAVQLNQVQLQEVIEQLKQDDSILLQAYSEYSAENGYNSIYDNDEESINNLYSNPYDALLAAFYGDYNPSHAYFTFNGYGNLQSFEYLDSDSSPIDVEELAQWIIDEDKLSEYDITVITLDDMLASIEYNITDDVNMLNEIFDYLHIPIYYQCFDGSDNDKVSEAMKEIYNYDYNQLSDIIKHLGINYQ